MPPKWIDYLLAHPPILPLIVLLLIVVVIVGFLSTTVRAGRRIRTAMSDLSKRDAKHDMRYEDAMRRQDVQTELLQRTVSLLTTQNELLAQTLAELKKMSGNQAP